MHIVTQVDRVNCSTLLLRALAYIQVSILNRPEPDRTGTRRRWTIPVPPPGRWSRFEGAVVLDEVPALHGLALWSVLRDVLLWAAAAPESRAGMFVGPLDDGLSGGISEALPSVAPVLDRLASEPEHCTPAALAGVCRAISAWVEGAGYVRTAHEFAEAVHHLLPNEPDSALFAGRAARHAGAFDRAEQWYKRALGLARAHGDRQAYTLALIRRGVVAEERGDKARAKDLHEKGWLAAKRYKLRKLGAYARHELLVLAIYTDSFAVAQEHARVALRLYGRFDERFPQLAHDTAFLWAWHGHFSAALPVYRAVLPYLVRAGEQIQVQANIGRAAAAVGDTDGFFRAWDQVNATAEQASEYRATALLALAYGARTLRRTGLARELAQAASHAAQLRGERQVVELAQTLLGTLRQPGDRDHPPIAEMQEMSEILTRRLIRNSPLSQ
jgi:tetratricopeptide (TPR) repeat protein